MACNKRSRILLLLLTTALLTVAVSAVETVSQTTTNGSLATGSIVGGFGIGDMYDNFTCVYGCSCYLTDFLLSRYAVVCSGVSIRAIPAFLTEDLHQIESMTLTRTSIAQIDSLRMFSSLTYLNLNGSRVQSIDSRLVSTFPALEQLHLAENSLRHLTDFSIIQHLALRTLDVSANELTGFDRSGSMSLREVNLKRNLMVTLNDLSTNYASLRRLDASENRLTLEGLSSWEPPMALEVLDLSDNRLKGGGANATFLARLPQLQQLILTGNQLDSLAPVVDWLPPGAKLWKLALSGNPFTCTCGLYRDKEKLAMQGVIIADSPSCRLVNGSEFTLTRLGSWACANGGDGGSGGLAAAGGFGDLLKNPLAIALTAVVAAVLVCLAVGFGVCACRRGSQQQQEQQHEAEYPYNTISVKSTNLTGSQMSVATSRSNLPYGFDPQRSRVFTKRAGEQQQQQMMMMGQRSQSEQILGTTLSSRGSTPLPPIPNSVRMSGNQASAAVRPGDYVDMGSGGYQQIPEAPPPQAPYTYDEVQMRQPCPQPPPPPPPLAVQEGYVDMVANERR